METCNSGGSPNSAPRPERCQVTTDWLTIKDCSAASGMLKRKYGRIVNVASIAGKEGNPTLIPYSASKAGLINMTKALAKEVVGKGDITVNGSVGVGPTVSTPPVVEGMYIANGTFDTGPSQPGAERSFLSSGAGDSPLLCIRCARRFSSWMRA